MMKGFQIGIRRACAVIIGIVLFFAGLLKLMDPVGTGLVVEAYLKFFHVSFLLPAAKVAGVFVALVETSLGVILVTGLWRKVAAVATFVVLSCFTLLTLVLLIANPEMSCGCFGEAFPLTHLQSFLKNVTLCLLSCAAFIPLQDGAAPRKPKFVAFALVEAFVVFFTVYSLNSIPFIDFTDYSRGVELEDRHFSFRDDAGEYADSLVFEGKTLFITVFDPESMTEEDWTNVNASVEKALDNAVRPILLSSERDAVPPVFEEFLYVADPGMLMTFNRSNGGTTYVSEGLVVDKWKIGALPGREAFATLVAEDPYDRMLDTSSYRRLTAESVLLACLAVMLLL